MGFRKGLFLGLLLNAVDVFGETPALPEGTTSLPNSCTNLEDGQHYLKLMEGDDYPVILATCSNGYVMIDYSLDSDWSYYFTSFLKWHYAIGGPTQQHHVNWAEWFLPDDSETNYLISPSCDVCSEDVQGDLRNTQGLQSGYYMNANLYGCFVYPRGMPDCDFDIDTYECHACYTDNFSIMYTVDWDDEDMTDFGACMTWIRGAYDEVDRTFDECTDQTENGYKPTIGLKGEFCVCTQPSATQFVSVTTEQIAAKKESMDAQAVAKEAELTEESRLAAKQPEDETFYLYKKDFEKGTLRIKEPGTYILMEDVEFDFNPGSRENPNAQGSWFPSVGDEEYPGYGDTRETFFMGWFAGITIECDNVVLNLNGHELKQSKAFFYQQGFFSAIEVESQPFMPGQGVGFFGSDPVFPDNVVIKNGNIGRTSHHCIHGNFNKNLLIEDLNCYDFSTHGIQLNGFDGLTMKNVDIGPSNTEQFLASEYTHYRFILDRLRIIAERNPTGSILFEGRENARTMGDIAEELEKKMDMAFKYVMYDETYEEDDEDYEDFMDALSIFVNDNGLGYGASQYGLFLSYPGANVLSYHLNSKTSNDATLENVKIHDLHHKTKEYVGIRTTLRLFVNSFNAPLHLKYLLGEEKFDELIDDGPDAVFDSSFKYAGNILTDATLAMTKLNDDWGLNQIMFVLSHELTAWATGEIDGGFNGNQAMFLCAIDGMIHSVKGTFGLRIDGVDDVKIDGLEVYNIQEDSPMGVGICGFCEQCAFESRSPYSVYYGGNVAQAISIDYATPLVMKDVTVDNIKSLTGKVNGVALWPGVDAEFKGTISVSNLDSGSEIDKSALDTWAMPMSNPEVCAIQVYDAEWGYNEDDNDNDISTVTYGEDVKIVTQCVAGAKGCWGDDRYTMHGDSYTCTGSLDREGLISLDGNGGTSRVSNSDGAKAGGAPGPPQDVADGVSAAGAPGHPELNAEKSLLPTQKFHFNYVVFGIISFLVAYWIIWTLKCKNKGMEKIGSSNKAVRKSVRSDEQTPLIF